MGVKEKFFRLKEACVKSKGADRIKADQEMEAFFNSIRPEDEAELQAAVSEDFARIHEDIEEAKILRQRIEVRKILFEILPFISVSEFSKTYFGKSASWLHQRINGNEVHGKTATFTSGELHQLADALNDVADKLKKAATAFV
ncbi:DUF5053 domain-containing protein [Bacteroides sp. Marseille-P8574]|uniref:DUF5053 domain-containing protein n=1 Tax=Bacteroides sp. Marseille-P8574 TaxID=2697504 RepID=UPI00157DA41D|nr:DUF5053 domain-containing protein [Bacteroides sp. Marseille-P8574]